MDMTADTAAAILESWEKDYRNYQDLGSENFESLNQGQWLPISGLLGEWEKLISWSSEATILLRNSVVCSPVPNVYNPLFQVNPAQLFRGSAIPIPILW